MHEEGNRQIHDPLKSLGSALDMRSSSVRDKKVDHVILSLFCRSGKPHPCLHYLSSCSSPRAKRATPSDGSSLTRDTGRTKQAPKMKEQIMRLLAFKPRTTCQRGRLII